MRHWRAVLRIRSPLATALSAERLFGHVCWGLAYRQGPAAVAEFLSRMQGERPPLVLGEPVPAGFVPMPIVLQTGLAALSLRGKRQVQWSRYRRFGLMPRAALLRAAGALGNAGAVAEALEASGWPSVVRAKREARVRSATSRLNGTPSGRRDWLAVEVWPEPAGRGERGEETVPVAVGGQVEVPIASDLEVGEIERLLWGGLENGFGRAASVGYGQVELAAVEPVDDWPSVADANAVVTLGPCVPRQNDPAAGWWQVVTHWGKLGGSHVAGVGGREVGGVSDGGNGEQRALCGSGGGVAVEKRPVMGLRAGAVLRAAATSGELLAAGEQQGTIGANDPLHRGFVGRLVKDVHPQRPEVVHYGMAPVVAVKL